MLSEIRCLFPGRARGRSWRREARLSSPHRSRRSRMPRQRWLERIVPAVVLVAAAAPAGAQPGRGPAPIHSPGQSHRDIGLPGDGAASEDLLQQRLRMIRGAADAEKVAREMIGDPKIKQQLEDLLRSGKGLDANDEGLR